MRKRTRSILEELNSITYRRDSKLLIENRGVNLIESAINLISLIDSNYSSEESEELIKRFISAIRSSDSKKFTRGIDKIQESKKNS